MGDTGKPLVTFVHFTLKRKGWGYTDLYEALKTGAKTSEWRDSTGFWEARLLNEHGRAQMETIGRLEAIHGPTFKPAYLPTFGWKHRYARFVVGYTKYPRLEAEITFIKYHSSTKQFEVGIKNPREITGPRMGHVEKVGEAMGCLFNGKLPRSLVGWDEMAEPEYRGAG